MLRKSNARRGVVILVVLSLLVLFVLLVVTFAIVAGQYRRAAQAYARKEWFGEDPQKVADRVMYALLREPTSTQAATALSGHSLLRDVYGASFRGAVTAGSATTSWSLAGGQIIQFNVSSTSSLKQLQGFYNGSVLTFVKTSATSRQLQGVSTRVVGYSYDLSTTPPTYTLRIINPLHDATAATIQPQLNDEFVLNLKPFVGTGFGHVAAAGANAPRLSEEALKPNRTGDDAISFSNYVLGGANESYDAPDYQNMILAAVTSNGVLPSFHRPELVAHWISRESGASPNRWDDLADPTAIPAVWTPAAFANYRDFRRKLIFRPMPWDHPDFSGSNAYFDGAIHSAEEIHQALQGITTSGEMPWDIDNDGDGVRDSIWIDPDLPLQTTEDGRSYKTLVAVLVVDMDGRLNVNAHGHYGHLAGIIPGYPLAQAVPLPGATAPTDSATLGLPKGQGYGPPEVNLNRLINDNTQYLVLLQSRYGTTQQPGQTGYDPLMPFKLFEYPNNYFSTAFLSSFSSNMDLRGLFACGVDYRGQPLYEGIYDTTTTPWTFADLLAESPYEFNLNKRSAADAPFTVAELEKVLRLRDHDTASLQSRLTDAATLTFLQGNTAAAEEIRRAVTTDSWDIPVPGVVCPDDYASSFSLSQAQTIMEMLAARLNANGVTGAAADNEITKMLSFDLMMGLRMDINRPIGNGRDDNGNAVVDDAHGASNLAGLNESLGPEYAKHGATNIMPIDHDNDGTINNDSDAYLARSYLARHLYVLLMLLKDPSFQYDLDGDGNATADETAQVLAQWAINVVDFRDADSIMTPFEYDVNPFNGWQVDGNILTNDSGHPDRRVVWGCERPELLISETLAMHDVRTEDLADPGDTMADGDPDHDQRLGPRGSLFVELYNPWAGHDKPPGEFYHSGTNWNSGVLLNKTNSAGQPVWRLAITDSAAADHLHPDPQSLAMAAPERTVYFTNPVGLSAEIPMNASIHYTNVAGIAPLLPGRYALVGSGDVILNGEYVTTIGRRTDAGETADGGTLGLEQTRQIVLKPNANPNVNQVEVRNNFAPPATQADAVSVDTPQPPAIQPAIAIPINVIPTGTGNKGKGKGGRPPEEIPLSISEPIGGYTDVNWDPTLADGEGAYSPPYDTPLDAAAPFGPVLADSTQPDYRRIHLQRLANPLAPYHAVNNPYLTIDVMPVDLTVFNGVENAGGATTTFGCYQRGADDGGVRSLWHQPTTAQMPPPVAPPGDGGVHVFGFQLRHALGYLNTTYGTGFTNANAPPPPPFAVTSYVGAPDSTNFPFPWLTWNNRPYVSPTELLLVPRSSSPRLLRDFSLGDTSDTPYSPATFGRFHHLLNFFAADANPNDAPNLYRIFEFLTVRPRFAGTETLLNPSTTPPHFGSNQLGTEMLHPPFNWISTYREPGRINLNTVYDSRVWDALWASHQQPISFAQFVDSRRGYAAASGAILHAPTATAPPTFFANPFRASGTSWLIPPDSGGGSNLGRLEVDATLLRTNRSSMGTSDPATTDMPAMLNSFAEPARHSDRNAFFSYQGLQRLPNLVTCRSNVYAIWLTIGYFEYEFNTARGRWELGQEVGLDTGQVRRHRAFYVIDRTIPVAFEPGENHNVDKCVLLRRFIE